MNIIRNLPVQRRSEAQLTALEDATVEAINQYGRDSFTTNQVAEIAGVSIGTVYRYFPNRVALLNHLWPDRDAHLPEGFKLQRLGERVTQDLVDAGVPREDITPRDVNNVIELSKGAAA